MPRAGLWVRSIHTPISTIDVYAAQKTRQIKPYLYTICALNRRLRDGIDGGSPDHRRVVAIVVPRQRSASKFYLCLFY